MENNSLLKLDTATKMLAEIRTIDDAKDLINLAEAARVYAKQVELGLEAQNHAAEIKLRAQRRAGEILEKIDGQQGARTDLTILEPQKKLKMDVYKKAGISPFDAHRWQTIAAMPEEKFEQIINQTKADEKELTTALIYKSARGAYVGNNSGENEWYTPPDLIEAARETMGRIDLDPASSDLANQIVKAETYYTIDDDGLAQEWHGNVWLNPPYSQPLVDRFSEKMAQEVSQGHVDQALMLVNNATETAWLQRMMGICRAICFLRGRVKYLDASGKSANTPLQGQVILYFGEDIESFQLNFGDKGIIFHG